MCNIIKIVAALIDTEDRGSRFHPNFGIFVAAHSVTLL
jgi:hypothetical protein